MSLLARQESSAASNETLLLAKWWQTEFREGLKYSSLYSTFAFGFGSRLRLTVKRAAFGFGLSVMAARPRQGRKAVFR